MRDMKSSVQDFEKRLIMEALAETQWRQRQAARNLGVLPTTLHEKMKRLGIPPRPDMDEQAPGAAPPDPALTAEDEGREEFRWVGRLRVGRTLEIVGVNGRLRVDAAHVDNISIVAVTSGPLPRRRLVTIRVMPTRSGMRLVARTAGDHPPGPRARVDTWVRAPVGVRLVGRVGSGHVECFGVAGRLELRGPAASRAVVPFTELAPEDLALRKLSRAESSEGGQGNLPGGQDLKPGI
jgi:hypothetical protein